MERDLLAEFSNTSIIAEDLYHSGILQKQSYLALNNFFFHKNELAQKALIKLLFEELIDPITYDHFKDYSRIKFNRSFGILNSMG